MPAAVDDRHLEVQVREASIRPLHLPDLGVLEERASAMAGHRLFLFNLIRETSATHVVEIGFGGANSAVAFLLGLKETGGMLTSIDAADPFDWAAARIDAMDARTQWRFVHATSDDAVGQMESLPPIDILLIDGCHSYDQCRRDYLNYSPLVRVGGYVLFHDSSTIKGVIEFTQELLDRGLGGVNLEYCNGLFVLHKRTARIW
jgi:predicted O-methyltransferase YrrM